MKVKVIEIFRDKYTNEVYKINDEINIDENRFKEINQEYKNNSSFAMLLQKDESRFFSYSYSKPSVSSHRNLWISTLVNYGMFLVYRVPSNFESNRITGYMTSHVLMELYILQILLS